MRFGVLIALAAMQVACTGDDDPNGAAEDYDQPVILGIWTREVDGHHVVREFYEGEVFTASAVRTTGEWYYPVGEEPIWSGGGEYVVEDGITLLTGEVADDVLFVYPGTGDIDITYDLIVDVRDDTLVLRGEFADEPVEYTSVDELP